MIIDIKHFIAQEQQYWDELDRLLNEFEREPVALNDVVKLRRLHYLYQRASADLARIMSFSSERILREHLESLVSRAYGEIHDVRGNFGLWPFLKNFLTNAPAAFQKYKINFVLSCLIFMVGALFGGMAISFDPAAKEILMPFTQLLETPQERVSREESATKDRLQDYKTTFSSSLWTHNTKVSIMMIAFGITWALGTTIMLFYNGLILGAVALDYVHGGQTTFLLGWLLPHGVIEIPALLIAGQVGIMLGSAMIGWGDSTPMVGRLRKISPDILALSWLVVVMLAWAGFVEAFISQYHSPVIPYSLKIGFGVFELIILVLFLNRKGLVRNNDPKK